MALREIHTFPSPILKKKAATVEGVGPELRALVEDMFETMYAAPGIGLAAPQVGVSERVIVIDLSAGLEPGSKIVLVNPEILESRGERESEEGCLSLPELSVKVCRAESVVVRGLDGEGREVIIEADDLLARALQHEIDHLEGILLVDRLNPVRREIVKKKLRKALASAG